MRKLLNSELERLSTQDYKQANKIPLILVLDNIRSMHNIGSVFRTADAFRIEAIYLCGITACPPHKDIHKTALGATESVDWKYYKTTQEAIDQLKKNQFKIFGIEQAKPSTMLNEHTFNSDEKIAIIFGNEVKGIDEEVIEHLDQCIEIPQFGTKHSLNISVCVGIVVWHLFLSYKKAGVYILK